MSDLEKQVERERRRIRDRMRRSVMKDEERSQQNERRRIEYKRRRNSMSNEELAREKQIRHERYLQRRYGTCNGDRRSNNATDISDVFGEKITQATDTLTSLYVMCTAVDGNGPFQMPYTADEALPCSTVSTTGECPHEKNTLARKAERERRRLRECMRRSAMTEEQRARHNKRRRFQYRCRKDQMSSQQLCQEEQSRTSPNSRIRARDVVRKKCSDKLPVQPRENQTFNPSDTDAAAVRLDKNQTLTPSDEHDILAVQPQKNQTLNPSDTYAAAAVRLDKNQTLTPSDEHAVFGVPYILRVQLRETQTLNPSDTDAPAVRLDENQTLTPSDEYGEKINVMPTTDVIDNKETNKSSCKSEKRKCCALSPNFAPSLTADDVNYVMDILREHATVEASKIVNGKEIPTISIMSGRLELCIDKNTPMSLTLELSFDDYVDIYEGDNVNENGTCEDRISDGGYEVDSTNDGISDQFCVPKVDLPKVERQRRKSILRRSFRNCARDYIGSPYYERFTLPSPRICKHC